MPACANPLSTRALTENQFVSAWDDLAAGSAALTEPWEQAFTVPTRTSTYRVVVRNTAETAAHASVHLIPEWVTPTIAAFMGIQNLQDNWDSYGGKVVNRELISQSLLILCTVMQSGSPTPSVVPISDGGLQIEWHRKQQDLEISFTSDEAPRFYYRNRATGVLDEGSARETEKLIRLVKDLV